MDELGEVVPQPEDRKDYTRLHETAPEILEASKKHPPENDKEEVEKKEPEDIGHGTGW